jgi:uncharacterized repeat protein (TIGR01451 family)
VFNSIFDKALNCNCIKSKSTSDCVFNQRTSSLKHFVIALFVMLAGVILPVSAASAQTFALTSVPNSFTAIYTDTTDASRTITVTLEPQDTACAAFDATGRATLFARSSVAACDRTIEMTFTTSGFALNSIGFNDIDDMDGIAPRDSFAANVPGTWSSPTIEVHSFASPPAFADQAGRLTSAGAVGTFLANAFGENNPTNETAEFVLTTPATSITIYYDDVEGARNARAQFSLDPLGASVNPNADLVTTKILASGDNQPSVGDVVTFEIGVANNGPANATGISTSDLLPAGLTATANNGTVSGTGGSTGGSYNSGTGLWSVGDLASGETATLIIEGTVDPGQGGQIIQNTLNAATGNEPDPSTGGDDLDESVVVDNEITAEDNDFSSSPIPSTGGNTASVFGNDTLNGAAFADADVTPSISDPDGLTGVTINPDGTLSVPAGSAPGTYNVEYQICEVANPTNCDTAIATIVIEAVADLAITKTNTPGVNGEVDQAADTVTSGTTTTYTLVVTNNGPDALTGGIVTDTPGSGITCPPGNPVTITGNGVPSGTFTVADLFAGITLGTLANGDAATLTFSCQVD